MTQLLFRDDAYRQSCDAKVLGINERGGILAILRNAQPLRHRGGQAYAALLVGDMPRQVLRRG